MKKKERLKSMGGQKTAPNIPTKNQILLSDLELRSVSGTPSVFIPGSQDRVVITGADKSGGHSDEVTMSEEYWRPSPDGYLCCDDGIYTEL